MAILAAVREQELPDGYVGGGVVRNVVWDYLHRFAKPSFVADVDVGYFDPVDMRPERDLAVEEALKRKLPGVPWDVKNQAGVHLWYEERFGHSIEPYKSAEDAISTFPEYATSVGIRVNGDERLEVIAPLGLDDLFNMTVRRNPCQVTLEIFRRRIAEKKYNERWPEVRIVAG